MAGGSKKGEHRGGAKPKRHWTPNPEFGKSVRGGKSKGTKNKPRGEIAKEVLQILGSKAEPATKELKLETYFLISNKRLRMPKEVMLAAMAFFEETAIEDVELMYANLERAGQVEAGAAKTALLVAAEQFETRAHRNLITAVDIGYKLAPFIHARYSAIINTPGSTDSPLNVLGVLLRDLDEAGRPARYLDHEPQADQKQD